MNNITFKNGNIDVAGILHLPQGFDETKKYPAIIRAHPISSCKEQTAGEIYGKKLAEIGYVVAGAKFETGEIFRP